MQKDSKEGVRPLRDCAPSRRATIIAKTLLAELRTLIWFMASLAPQIRLKAYWHRYCFERRT
jgi:hypothetical protein